MMTTATDTILEALQHGGGWMTLAEVQVVAGERSSAGCYSELQRLVHLQQAASERNWKGQTVWRAVMERP